jgi:hypothetical protein
MGIFGPDRKFRGQDYNKCKKNAKAKGTLFVDREFPSDDSSIGSEPGKHGNIVWKRPKVNNKNKPFIY